MRTPAVILNIQRQPSANTIQVVNSIQKLLPQLEATLPASVHVQVITDRTTAIRASVDDVEFELMLTIALVVMVIFLFLRSLSATIIPSVAVPLSLVGTLGVMYLAGYSLNNLTMMALTISTGFVVDDAIVMIENISRYIEEGDPPMEAALKGAEQIGFTILSLTVSLIAVLIPLLFMGDVAGRLFRQFAVTLAVTIILSAFVSLTLTPMMSARILKYVPEDKQGRFYHVSEKIFNDIIAFYGRTLKVVLRFQFLTMMVFLATLILTAVLYITIPKGFFPTQDTGIIQGITQASPSISFAEMTQKQLQIGKLILQDPAVAGISSFIGADGTNTTLNSGRIQIQLKGLGSGKNERNESATDVIARLGNKLASVPGIKLYMQPIQDLTVDDQVSRTEYQYTIEDPSQAELNTVTAKFLKELQKLPELQDVVTDQQLGGGAETLVIDRATASRFGITPSTIDNTLYDAFGQRQINTQYTQLNQYHVILETDPRFQSDPNKLNDIYIQSSATSSTSGETASNTAGSSAGAGNGASTSSGNAQMTATATNGVNASASNTSALSTGNQTPQVPGTSAANASSALSMSNATAGTTNTITSSSTSTGTSSSNNTATAGTTRSGSGTTTAPGASTTNTSAASVSSGTSSSGQSTTLATPVPLSAFTHFEASSEPLSINHQGQFPSVTVSVQPGARLFALAGARRNQQNPEERQDEVSGLRRFELSGHFGIRELAFERGLLILAALVTVIYRVGRLVRVIRSSADDSLDASVSGCRRAAGAAAVQS